MNNKIAAVGGCVGVLVMLQLQPYAKGAPAAGTGIAAPTNLPSLGGGPSEALGINEAGTVIVGSSWDKSDLLHGVTWTLRNGSWAITTLPHAADATSSIARGVNNHGDAAGNDFPGSTSHAVLWPTTGGFVRLGCADAIGPATGHAISAGAQVVVGQQGGAAAVWQLGSCRVTLPPLISGRSASAFAINGDGSIVGGNSASVPVRWRFASDWQIEQLDTRGGAARGANSAGDLAGYVSVPCELAGGCQRAVIWYAAGGSFELGTLGGAHSSSRDINASNEVVGLSTSPRGVNTGFFWSESTGMVQLPFKGSWAAANAVSDVRSDGTRLVVGMSSRGTAIVWTIPDP